MSENDIWKKYAKKEIIGVGTYGNIYKGINKSTGDYCAIREIVKSKYISLNNSSFNEKKIKELYIKGNPIIREVFNSKDYFYIIMDLCICNLEDYIKMRKDKLSMNEIQKLLIQLNDILKNYIKKEIILSDLKQSNILLSIDTLDKISVKLFKLNDNNILNEINSKNVFNSPPTKSPQILKGEPFTNKTIIWSLGIIIYYLLFKEYPFNGKTEYQIIKEIESNKSLNPIYDEELNDLVNKMLKINENERISWNDYLLHPFFQKILKHLSYLNLISYANIIY